uniref:Splicing factor 3B subunit 6 n=1 Tax=Cebus imitator TaxID=2715852 RepID=A0A2K5PJB5_CEBIM
MAMQAAKRANIRLPPEVNRILYIRNLPYKITAEEMYGIFGKYGPIRQIRVGNTPETRGTAYVVYEDIFDAKNACDHLSGFNICNRYLVVLYYNANRLCEFLCGDPLCQLSCAGNLWCFSAWESPGLWAVITHLEMW